MNSFEEASSEGGSSISGNGLDPHETTHTSSRFQPPNCTA